MTVMGEWSTQNSHAVFVDMGAGDATIVVRAAQENATMLAGPSNASRLT